MNNTEQVEQDRHDDTHVNDTTRRKGNITRRRNNNPMVNDEQAKTHRFHAFVTF